MRVTVVTVGQVHQKIQACKDWAKTDIIKLNVHNVLWQTCHQYGSHGVTAAERLYCRSMSGCLRSWGFQEHSKAQFRKAERSQIESSEKENRSMHEDVIVWHGFEIRWLADEVCIWQIQLSQRAVGLLALQVAAIAAWNISVELSQMQNQSLTAWLPSKFSPRRLVNLRREKLTSYHFGARRGARELTYETGDTDSGATNVDLRRKAMVDFSNTLPPGSKRGQVKRWRGSCHCGTMSVQDLRVFYHVAGKMQLSISAWWVPPGGRKEVWASLSFSCGLCWYLFNHVFHMAVCQNLVPLVNIKIAVKWMFIPLKMVLIGIDPYPCLSYLGLAWRCVARPQNQHQPIASSPASAWPSKEKCIHSANNGNDREILSKHYPLVLTNNTNIAMV